ncbi:DUF6262 family protein [Crocosphaera chwakensis]|uniref:Tn554 transposase C n=1 Tax=Crocosphaera chwakensis CCY0110 TaxID=391612 RepID=A3IZK7_9CHRO|nr:DUF6262 family protein [Crocosphaera chwakensis]EAZ88044.1 Tn554 transposase C [Crocosphaera chwakensis CCY0110]EAZ88102.1 Tn554 transposase C [Crocosphaera chwakensis CCY0110]
MAKKHNREKQAEVLRRTQAQRKEQKKEQVLKAVQEIIAQKKSLTFANIAKVAGCSVSYLYKWDEIKAYIHELQQKENTQLNPLEEPEARPNSLKTLHEVARQRIKALEAEIKDLKQQNEKLRGHVVEIYELRDECERLRKQLRELLNTQNSSSKVIPIQTPLKDKKVSISNPENEDTPETIINLIKEMGLKVGAKLKEEINNRDPQQVKLAIDAFQQYRNHHTITSQEACLLSMIREEAQPNTSNEIVDKPSKPTIHETSEESNQELVSLDKLKQLSSLFNSKS